MRFKNLISNGIRYVSYVEKAAKEMNDAQKEAFIKKKAEIDFCLNCSCKKCNGNCERFGNRADD